MKLAPDAMETAPSTPSAKTNLTNLICHVIAFTPWISPIKPDPGASMLLCVRDPMRTSREMLLRVM